MKRPKDTKFSGIYLIVNLLDGKYYVGQSVNIHTRIYGHEHDARSENPQYPLHRAMKKYGIENFKLTILEKVEDILFLGVREQFWIDVLEPFKGIGYNVCRQAGSTSGFKMSESTKQKMSISRLGREVSKQTREKISQAHLGKPKASWSDSQREKFKLAMTGKRHTDLTKSKISARHSRPVDKVCLLTGNILETFSSITAAQNITGITNISRSIKDNQHKTAGGFKWQFSKQQQQPQPQGQY